jgi:phosphoribosylaminoimidazole carboxylase (NCAIR synthetase)
VEEAARHDDEVMIESYVPGRELTVAVVGDRALPVGEIFPEHEIYDYECKYTEGMASEKFPADLPDGCAAEAQRLAIQAFRALKLGGCARIDFRMTERGELFCLEAAGRGRRGDGLSRALRADRAVGADGGTASGPFLSRVIGVHSRAYRGRLLRHEH